MKNPPTIAKLTIGQLRNHLLAKRFAVPKLQRSFVWDSGRAAKLLDSVFHRMPIGSMFFWEMDHKSANLIRTATGVLPPFSAKNKHVWFVIDGQQRLSVIHQAFVAELQENDAGRTIDFGRLCFVVRPPEDADRPQRIVYRKPIEGSHVPLRDILAPDWRKKMPNSAAWFLNCVKECRRRILRYPVPVVTIHKASLDEVGEIFIRVNSQGMRISSADRAIALMGSLDLREMAHELRHAIRGTGFHLKGIDPILMGLNLATERPEQDAAAPKLDVMARRWTARIEKNPKERKNFEKVWHRFKRAFSTAVDFLRHNLWVYDESFLPSANMIATLSIFFYHHQGQPNARQRAEIRKWFWATGVAQRYTGRGYHHNLVADANMFESLARGGKRRFVLRDRVDPVIDIQGSQYSSGSALTKAFFCLLASLGPRYLENGEPIPLGANVLSHVNRKHRHHVFPQVQMSKLVSPKAYNSLLNICFLVSTDNTSIGSKLPRIYLATYQDAGRNLFKRVMKSHLIPVSAEDGVWERSVVKAFKRFRAARLKLICSAFEKAAGMKLFRRL